MEERPRKHARPDLEADDDRRQQRLAIDLVGPDELCRGHDGGRALLYVPLSP